MKRDWHPVTEPPPQDGEYLVACHEHYGPVPDNVQPSIRWVGNYINGNWYVGPPNSGWPGRMTHWKEAPSLPGRCEHCNSELIERRSKLVCSYCKRINEGCCEGTKPRGKK